MYTYKQHAEDTSNRLYGEGSARLLASVSRHELVTPLREESGLQHTILVQGSANARKLGATYSSATFKPRDGGFVHDNYYGNKGALPEEKRK